MTNSTRNIPLRLDDNAVILNAKHQIQRRSHTIESDPEFYVTFLFSTIAISFTAFGYLQYFSGCWTEDQCCVFGRRTFQTQCLSKWCWRPWRGWRRRPPVRPPPAGPAGRRKIPHRIWVGQKHHPSVITRVSDNITEILKMTNFSPLSGAWPLDDDRSSPCKQTVWVFHLPSIPHHFGPIFQNSCPQTRFFFS